MDKTSKTFAVTNSGTASTGSRKPKPDFSIVDHPLTPSEIAWLRLQKRRVFEAFTRSKAGTPEPD